MNAITGPNTFVALAVIGVMTLIYWFVSNRAPRGVLLLVGLVLWIAGYILVKHSTGDAQMAGVVIKVSGYWGCLLAIYDWLRKPFVKNSATPEPEKAK